MVNMLRTVFFCWTITQFLQSKATRNRERDLRSSWSYLELTLSDFRQKSQQCQKVCGVRFQCSRNSRECYWMNILTCLCQKQQPPASSVSSSSLSVQFAFQIDSGVLIITARMIYRREWERRRDREGKIHTLTEVYNGDKIYEPTTNVNK